MLGGTVAERAFVSCNALERGDCGIWLASYVAILFVLGLAGRSGNLTDLLTDGAGISLEGECLPARQLPARQAIAPSGRN
jgi:hypothetical protein